VYFFTMRDLRANRIKAVRIPTPAGAVADSRGCRRPSGPAPAFGGLAWSGGVSAQPVERPHEARPSQGVPRGLGLGVPAECSASLELDGPPAEKGARRLAPL